MVTGRIEPCINLNSRIGAVTIDHFLIGEQRRNLQVLVFNVNVHVSLYTRAGANSLPTPFRQLEFDITGLQT